MVYHLLRDLVQIFMAEVLTDKVELRVKTVVKMPSLGCKQTGKPLSHYYKDFDGVMGHWEAHPMPMLHQELLCLMGIFFFVFQLLMTRSNYFLF